MGHKQLHLSQIQNGKSQVRHGSPQGHRATDGPVCPAETGAQGRDAAVVSPVVCGCRYGEDPGYSGRTSQANGLQSHRRANWDLSLEEAAPAQADQEPSNWRALLPGQPLDGVVRKAAIHRVSHAGISRGLKLIAAAAALFFTAPAMAQLEIAPYSAQRQQLPAEMLEAIEVHRLKKRADQMCRVTEDIRLFNPYGGMWASKGSFIKAVATAADEERQFYGTDVSEVAHLVKDCGLGRMAQFAGHSRETDRITAQALVPGIAPSTGGPVFVRSHTRCNSNKCWPVRSYTRRR